MIDVSQLFSAYRYSIILIGDAIQAIKRLALAEINGCQVRDWIVRSG